MSFETKWIAFFIAKSRCFLPRSGSTAKAMLCADETLSFQDNAIRATQTSNIFNKYQHGFCFYPVLEKGNVATTKDVKLVGYDFRGHTRGTLVVGIAYGYRYCKGSAIFSLVYFKYLK